MEIISISMPKSVVRQLKEAAKEKGVSLSSLVTYTVQQNLGLQDEIEEDENLERCRGFLELTRSELLSLYRRVKNSTDLVIFLKRHLRKGILATDVIEDEVIFKTRDGLVKIPYVKFNSIKEIKESIINLVREWKETIKRGKEKEEEKKIKSITNFIVEKGGSKNGKKN